MLRKTKTLIAVLTVFAIFITITGCTKKAAGPAKKTQTTEKIELVFYNLFDTKDTFAGQIQAFQSTHPNIKIRYEKYMDPEIYEDLIVNEIAEGKGPDIFAIHNTWILKHKNKLSPMPVSVPNALTPEKFQNIFLHVAAEDLIINKQIFGIPLSVDTLALYYNKEYLVSAVSGANTPARTWKDLKKQVISLTKRNNSKERFAVTGIAMGRADNITNATDILKLLFLEYETNFYDSKTQKAIFAEQQGTISGKAYLPGKEALELYTSFALPSYNHYSWNREITGNAPEEKEVDPFVRGKVAMIFGYSYLYDNIKIAITNQQKLGKEHIELKDVKVAPAPQILDPATTNKLFAYGSYYPLVVSRNSTNSEAAWEFLLYLSSKESLSEYFEKTHKISSRLDLQEEQSLNSVYGVFARQAKFARSLKEIDAKIYKEVFTKAIEDVLSTKDVKTALKNAQSKINCLIEQRIKKNPNLKDVNCLKI